MMLSVIILTFNSEATIYNTLQAARRVSDDICVVDSFSSDRTATIVEDTGAVLIRHEFINYSKQRNWAIDHLSLKYQWELHLDADEVLSDELIAELEHLERTGYPSHISGFFIPRLVHFLGRPIRHGGMFPIWHMRLFRRQHGRCEERAYDQHFVVQGICSKLQGAIFDDIKMSLSEWVIRHNRWSDAEVIELLKTSECVGVRPKLRGTPIERQRYLRDTYLRLPLFVRPWLLFIYRYLFRLGFLDGPEGLIFFFLQAFWFRFLIDAKIYEHKLADTRRAQLIARDTAGRKSPDREAF